LHEVLVAEEKCALRWSNALDVLVLLLWSAALLFLLNGQQYRYFLRPALGVGLAAALLTCLVFCVAIVKVRHDRGAGLLVAFARAAVLILPLLYAMVAGHSVLDSHAFATRWVGPASKADSAGKGLQASAVSAMPDEGDDDELVEVYRSSQARKIPPALRRALGLPPDVPENGEGGKKKGVLTATLFDLAEYGDRYKGRRVTTEGMVAWDKENKDRFYLFRFVIVCCVADAQPAAVLVECPETERPAQNAWVRAEGLADTIRVAGRAGAIIRNASLTPIPAPKDPYLY